MSDERPNLERARENARKKEGFKDENGQPLPLHGPLKQLGRGGVGIELFFRTIRLSIGVFFLLFLISVPSLVQNVRTPKAESEGLILATTLGLPSNLCGDAERCPTLWMQVIPWFIITVIIILFMYHIRYLQRTVAKEVDRRFITAGDYSVEVRGLPLNASSEPFLITFFEQFGKVHMVSVGYKCGEFVQLQRKWKELGVTRDDLLARAAVASVEDDAGGASSARRADIQQGLRTKAGEIEAEMVRLEEAMRSLQANDLEPTGAAFLIFETEAGRRQCLRAHNLELYERIAEWFGVVTRRPKYLDMYKLEVTPAPEPSDVYWENLEVGPEEVQKRSVRTTAFSVLLILASFGALLLFSVIKEQQEARLIRQERLNVSYGVSGAAAGAITLVNTALKYAVIYLTDFERRDTRTEYEESVYFKLTWAYIINQSLLVLIVGAISAPRGARRSWFSWFEDGGAMTQAFYILLANAVVPEFVKVVRVDVLTYRYLLARTARSQAKLEKYWEPPEATLGEFYAGITKTCCLGLLYGPAMPIAYIVTAVALCISYMANKYALLRVFKQPPAINEGLSEQYRTAMGWVILGSIILQLVYTGNREAQLMPIWLVVLWALYKFVPVKWLPVFRLYVDLDSDDTGGRSFSSIAGLPKYSCPIVMPIQSVRAPQRQGESLSGVRPTLAEGAGLVGMLGQSVRQGLGMTGGGGSQPVQPVQPAPQPPALPRAEAQPAPQQYPGQAPPQVAPTAQQQQMQARPSQSLVPQAYAQPAYSQPPPQQPPQFVPPSQYQQPPTVPTLLAVTCPDNVGPGSMMFVQDPRNGQLVRVTVPPGSTLATSSMSASDPEWCETVDSSSIPNLTTAEDGLATALAAFTLGCSRGLAQTSSDGQA
eukprot:CAMPEP_0119405646 /NCGR_PEP_ID=MMETSP1335-20130426/249_1 /TAXON_ID=259385 /ORGANISM="Chrysoculter rhomboideus, Strain RCC1486" /LENGTH=879 /DNA_ID=CAMNT_0007429669 /DNA_START=92 /DNA_END=2733 /DNA_ORIENTATION=-